MLVKMQCPQCGATLDFDDSRAFMFCSFCGTKIANISEEKTVNINQNINVSGTVVHKRDISNEPNLEISYSSTDLGLRLVTVVKDSVDLKWGYTHGQKMAYKLLPGMYTVIFAVPKHKWSRIIYIPNDNTPVRIDVVFSGRVSIYIDQPPQGLEDYERMLEYKKRQEEKQKAEDQRIAMEKKAEAERLAAEKRAENARRKVEKERVKAEKKLMKAKQKVEQLESRIQKKN